MVQVYDYEQGNLFIFFNECYFCYVWQEDGMYWVKNQLFNYCWKFWYVCVIIWDGLVVFCCFDKDVQYQLGDFRCSLFVELWQGEVYQ